MGLQVRGWEPLCYRVCLAFAKEKKVMRRQKLWTKCIFWTIASLLNLHLELTAKAMRGSLISHQEKSKLLIVSRGYEELVGILGI